RRGRPDEAVDLRAVARVDRALLALADGDASRHALDGEIFSVGRVVPPVAVVVLRVDRVARLRLGLAGAEAVRRLVRLGRGVLRRAEGALAHRVGVRVARRGRAHAHAFGLGALADVGVGARGDRAGADHRLAGRVGVAFVGEPVAVVVDAVADLDRPRVDVGIGVVAVDALVVAVAVGVLRARRVGGAVLRDAVAALVGRAGEDRRVVVVAVDLHRAARVAAGAGVGEAVAVDVASGRRAAGVGEAVAVVVAEHVGERGDARRARGDRAGRFVDGAAAAAQRAVGHAERTRPALLTAARSRRAGVHARVVVVA